MDYPELKDRVAIITGAASGMGKCFSKRLAMEGAIAVMTDINEEGLKAAAEEIGNDGGRVLPVPSDVRVYEQTERVVSTAIEVYGKVDIMINVAGGAAARMLNRPGSREFRNMDIDVLDWGLDVNLRGAMYFNRAVGGHMIDQKSGVILNMGSVVGCVGARFGVEYSAAKGGIISMTKALGMYCAPYGVRVNCVSPGPVLTRPEMANLKNYVGRAAEPDEIADLVLFLCSDHSKFIVGQNYIIDGGRVLGARGE